MQTFNRRIPLDQDRLTFPTSGRSICSKAYESLLPKRLTLAVGTDPMSRQVISPFLQGASTLTVIGIVGQSATRVLTT